jgi:hypothetical protein
MYSDRDRELHYKHELMVEIARILNESKVFIYYFVAMNGRLLGMCDIELNDYAGNGYYYKEFFHPSVLLSCVKGK